MHCPACRSSRAQLRNPNPYPTLTGKDLDHLALEHPRFSPTNRIGCSAAAPAETVSQTLAPAVHTAPAQEPPTAWAPGGGLALGPAGQPYPNPTIIAEERRGSPARKGAAAARLAAGEAPWDMLSLKAAIVSARPGAHGLHVVYHIQLFVKAGCS